MISPPAPADRPGRIEVRSVDHVPPEERHGRVRDQFTMWFGLNANIFVVVLGGVTVLLGLNFLWACLAITAGVVVGLVLVGFHAIQGPALGLPQLVQSRAQFGFYGAIVVFAASIVLDFGFLAAQLVIQADALHLLVPGIGIPAWIALLAVPVAVITIYGHDLLHALQRVMSVVLAVTFVVVLVAALRRGGLSGDAAGTQAPSVALFMGAMALFVVSIVSWAPYVSDYSRYLPETVSRSRTLWAVVLGCAIPQVFCAVLGAYVTALLPDASSTVAAVGDVAGDWVLPLMALSLLGSDVANSYTGMLAVAGIVSCFRDVRRSVVMRVAGALLVIALGTGSALLGYRSFVEHLGEFLNVLLFVFIPWSAINLTDYYLVRRGEYDIASFFSPAGVYGGVHWQGLVPYALAVAVQFPFIDQAFYRGPLVDALGGVDVSWVVGGVAGVVFYLAALRWVRPAPGPRPRTARSR